MGAAETARAGWCGFHEVSLCRWLAWLCPSQIRHITGFHRTGPMYAPNRECFIHEPLGQVVFLQRDEENDSERCSPQRRRWRPSQWLPGCCSWISGEASPKIKRLPVSKKCPKSKEWRVTISDLCGTPRKPSVKQWILWSRTESANARECV